MRKIFLLSLFIFHCSLFIDDSFAQNSTLKVCVSNANQVINMSKMVFSCDTRTNFNFFPGSAGGYRYILTSPNYGGLSAANSWAWLPRSSSTNTGVATLPTTIPNVTGRHICSSVQSGSPSSSQGQYCWCQLTSINGQGCSGAQWVQQGNYGSATSCANPGGCASNCANLTFESTSFRTTILAMP